MSDPDIDAALTTAADRAREAEQRLMETQVEDPAIIPKAQVVYQRAEELSELAADAASDSGT